MRMKCTRISPSTCVYLKMKIKQPFAGQDNIMMWDYVKNPGNIFWQKMIMWNYVKNGKRLEQHNVAGGDTLLSKTYMRS